MQSKKQHKCITAHNRVGLNCFIFVVLWYRQFKSKRPNLICLKYIK